MSGTLNKEQEQVAEFLAKLAGGLIEERGINVGITDLGVLTAGKKLGKNDCVPVLRAALVKFEAKYPGAFDILLAGASEKLKERIRRAAGAKPPIDV